MSSNLGTAERVKQVPVITDASEAQSLTKTKREPFILRGFDLGPCLTKWSPEYLSGLIKDKSVKIHVSSHSNMDFINKNFLYRSLPFDQFIKRVAEDEHQEYFIDKTEKYYLRSLGSDERKDVADIKKQFPELSNDINFPPFFEEAQFFSSVFRISSSQIRLWTHYDIMDNVLIQVVGSKRVILFPPSDIDFLYMKGDKSQVLDVDGENQLEYPLFSKATRYECVLKAGDSIFIPALWLHNVVALDFSIGVNVFWKHLDEEFYDKKDVYGNKDLTFASKAFLFADKAIKELNAMPFEYKRFYTKRIIQSLNENLSDLENVPKHAES